MCIYSNPPSYTVLPERRWPSAKPNIKTSTKILKYDPEDFFELLNSHDPDALGRTCWSWEEAERDVKDLVKPEYEPEEWATAAAQSTKTPGVAGGV